MRTRRYLLQVILLTALLPGSARLAQAQQWDVGPGNFRTDTYWAVGYSTNAPQQFLGGSTFLFGPRLRHWGLYIDAKSSINSPESERGYSLTLTPDAAEEFDDFRSTDRSAWRSLNIAVIRVVAPTLALYIGGGQSRERAYTRYFDESQERGYLGHYWVRNTAQSGNRLNLLAGAWFRITPHVLFQLGGELAPGGFTAGVAYALPLRR